MHQAFARGFEQRCDARSDAGNRAVREALCILFGKKVFAFSGDKFRAMESKQRLALLHVLIGGIRKHLLDVAGDARLHERNAALVNRDRPRRANGVFEFLPLDDSELHANGLQTFG